MFSVFKNRIHCTLIANILIVAMHRPSTLFLVQNDNPIYKFCLGCNNSCPFIVLLL